MQDQNDLNSVSHVDYKGPSSFVHLHNHSLFSTLDGCASPEDYAAACKKRDYPAMALTEHGHMASVPDFYLAFKKNNIKSITGCFLPHQPIYTTAGVKQFKDIKPNDYVLTHTAMTQRIENIQIREYNGEIIRLKAWGVEDQIVTPEHPFLVREVTRNQPQTGVWTENITIGYRQANELFREKYWRTYNTNRSKDRSNKRRYRFYLCVPRLSNNNSLQDFKLSEYIFDNNHDVVLNIENNIIETVKYTNIKFCSTICVNLPTTLQADVELLWIMGLWLAEGSSNGETLIFSLCNDELHFYDRIKSYFTKLGITTSCYRRDSDNESRKRAAIDITVFSSFISHMFIKLFGQGFANKRIPNEWMNQLSEEQTEALLNGLFDGDAKIGTQSSYLKLNNETLIWQTRLLFTKLTIPQSTAISLAKCNNSDNLSYIIRRREKGHFYYDYDDKYLYLPVHTVEREIYCGDVYNMEIENDNTYYTGVIAHNCEIYYNDWEPIRHDLLAKGIKIRSPDWKKEHPEENNRINRNRHLTILCKNEIGFENLIKLTTQAYSTGLYGAGVKQFNRIWFDKLCEHKEGLIILSGCLNGPICHELRTSEIRDKTGEVIWSRDKKKCLDDAVAYIKKFKSIFGDDYYIELQMPGVADDIKVFRMLVMLADQFKIKTVLANDCHYMDRKGFELQKIMMAIAQGVPVNSKDLFHVNSSEQYFKTRAELWERFKNNKYSNGIDDGKFEEMCDNTLLVADKIKQIKFDSDPKIPDIKDADQELRKIVTASLISKNLHKDTRKFIIDGKSVTYTEQAKLELDRFIDKGFSSYFIITQDLIKYGRDQGWPFSPRGCTVPDAQININKSESKRIVDIEIGDQIVDGFGDNRIVENKFIYDVSEDLYVFELDDQILEVTAEHKFYIIRDNIVLLLPASEIKDTDEIIGNIENKQDTHVKNN